MAIFNGLATASSEPIVGQLLLTIVAICLYPVILAIRNAYFHPLSKFPGPKSWAATHIPFISSLVRGKLIKTLNDLHDNYGDVIRVGPNEISFSNEVAWQDIYSHRPGKLDVTKDQTWYIAPNDMPQNIVTTNDPDVHARMRKLLSASFSEKSLRTQYSMVEAYTDLLVNRIRALTEGSSKNADGCVVDIVDWINFYTVDIIGDLALGESFGCMESSDYHPWVKTLDTFLKGMAYAAACRYYPSVEWIVRKMLPKSVMEKQRQHTEFVHDRIDRRLSLKTERPDFLTPVMKDNANFEIMSIGEIESTFAILIVAGSETTATVLSGIINYLVKPRNKRVLDKVVAEIRDAFEKEEHITIEKTKALSYLEAVINEGLRFCNPVPGGLPRVVPKGGGTYAGHYLPEDTHLSIRPFNLNRSNAYFNDAESFIPERWLPTSEVPPKFASDRLSVSNPFSLGPTSCLGRNLAWVEMRIFLTRLLWAFDIAEEDGKGFEWDSQKTLMLVQKKPQELRIKARPGVPPKNHDMHFRV